jgi:transcriptional regulator with XRE-family HTH domain
MKFGQWLAAERKRKAFTQDSFAVAAGYSQAMISKIENGGDITREFCAAAAKALGLSEEKVGLL